MKAAAEEVVEVVYCGRWSHGNGGRGGNRGEGEEDCAGEGGCGDASVWTVGVRTVGLFAVGVPRVLGSRFVGC